MSDKEKSSIESELQFAIDNIHRVGTRIKLPEENREGAKSLFTEIEDAVRGLKLQNHLYVKAQERLWEYLHAVAPEDLANFELRYCQDTHELEIMGIK